MGVGGEPCRRPASGPQILLPSADGCLLTLLLEPPYTCTLHSGLRIIILRILPATFLLLPK